MQNKVGFKETLQWYEENADNYANKIIKKQNSFLINRFLELLPKQGTILDAGCAAGRDCQIFKERDFLPTGIDAVESLIKIAKKNNPDIKYIHGDFSDLPFSDSSFDGIWSHASLLHLETIEDVNKALKEFCRVLKNGGIAHIFVKKQLGREKTSHVSQEYSGDFSRFFRWFNKKELTTLLKEAGFEIIRFDDNYVAKDGRKNIKWLAALVKKTK